MPILLFRYLTTLLQKDWGLWLERGLKSQQSLQIFDKFFDCLNMWSFTQSQSLQRPLPFFSWCMAKGKMIMNTLISNTINHTKWVEEDFMGYLQKWEELVKNRPGFSLSERNKMLLNRETRARIKITGNTVLFVTLSYITTCFHSWRWLDIHIHHTSSKCLPQQKDLPRSAGELLWRATTARQSSQESNSCRLPEKHPSTAGNWRRVQERQRKLSGRLQTGLQWSLRITNVKEAVHSQRDLLQATYAHSLD